MTELFEQQPRESAKAFAAFSVYLSLGPERSLAAVGQKLGKSVGLMERWSRKFDWAGRVEAQVAHLAKAEREATEVMARGKAVEWAKRQQEVREREWEMHEKCIAAAKRALAAFMEREKVYSNLADISRMLEVASKLGRLASGMASDKTEVTGEDGGAIRVELEAALKKVYGQVVEAEVVSQASDMSEHECHECHELEDRKAEVRGQRSEVRGQRSEVRGQRSEVRGQRSEVRSQGSEGSEGAGGGVAALPEVKRD